MTHPIPPAGLNRVGHRCIECHSRYTKDHDRWICSECIKPELAKVIDQKITERHRPRQTK